MRRADIKQVRPPALHVPWSCRWERVGRGSFRRAGIKQVRDPALHIPWSYRGERVG